jgi:hypothetical protein
METTMPLSTPFKMVLACTVLALAGCGEHHYNDDGGRISYTTQILSDPAFDGDIEQTSSTTYAVTQGMSTNVQSVFAGIDPVAMTEFRAFLNFPLSGVRGVPSSAIIESAYLNIYVNSLDPITGTLPIRIELVNFQPPTLIGTDFDRVVQPPLAYTLARPAFDRTDVGFNASIDVTSLMVRAQQLNLVDFQVRILEDLGPAIPVIMEINDTTGANRAVRAPLLIVSYH